MVGIVSNNAALFAQRNLDTAATQSESSIARLSSGNAIVRASDDVSGLAVGTVLRTNVSTLRTVLDSTAQASSLLGIADGGLQNIGEILQRQKALAVQANSGSLSANERAFLDQEFQNLTLEIDRIVTNTTFNGIALLDGTIGGIGNFGLEAADTDPAASLGLTGTLTGTQIALLSDITFGGGAGALDESIQGSVSNFGTIANGAGDGSIVSFDIGDATFAAEILDATYDNGGGGAAVDVVFTEVGSATPTTITFDITDTGAAGGSAAQVGQSIFDALQDARVTQTRNVTTTETVANDGVDLTNTVLAGLNASANNVSVITDAFDAVNDTFGNVTDVVVRAIGTNGTDDNGEISIVANGITFSTSFTTAAGSEDLVSQLGDDILDNDIASTVVATDLQGIGGEQLVLANVSEAGNIIDQINIDVQDLSSSLDLNLSDQAEALEDALRVAFGVSSSGSGGLTFQVGTTATDNISLSLSGAGTSDIYIDDTGATQTLDVTTATNAQTASDVLDNAINTVTSLRATVGALQSRFDFASANVTSSIQNTEAARSIFLDVDIANESTEFATAQVRLQASISVLAQANQLPQNLLKLVG